MSEAAPTRLSARTVVVCDDIRIEINGKLILIGVYSGAIIVPSLPADLVLSVWMQLQPSAAPCVIPVEFRLLGPHDVQFFHASADAHYANTDLNTAFFAGIAVPIQVPGELRFQMKQSGGEWETIKSVEVQKGAPPPRPNPT